MATFKDQVRVVVFDFDGTLVDSNWIKRNAYFQLFPQKQSVADIICKVLDTEQEVSRFELIQEIVDRLATSDLIDAHENTYGRMIAKYDDLVTAAVVACPATEKALALLKLCYLRWPLYLSSSTPENALKRIIQQRGWVSYFKQLFGYPRKKAKTLRTIIQIEGVVPDQVLVVGDGPSDEISASETGCRFFDAKKGLSKCMKLLELE